MKNEEKIGLTQDEEDIMLNILDQLERYAERELELAKKAESHWFISYPDGVEVARENLQEVKEWTRYFKKKIYKGEL